MNYRSSHRKELNGIRNTVDEHHARTRYCVVCSGRISGQVFSHMGEPMHQSCNAVVSQTLHYCARPAWLASGRYECVSELSEAILLARLAQRGDLHVVREWLALEDDEYAMPGEIYVDDDFEWQDKTLMQAHLDSDFRLEHYTGVCPVCGDPITGTSAPLFPFDMHQSCQATARQALAMAEAEEDQDGADRETWARIRTTGILLARLAQQDHLALLKEWTAPAEAGEETGNSEAEQAA